MENEKSGFCVYWKYLQEFNGGGDFQELSFKGCGYEKYV